MLSNGDEAGAFVAQAKHARMQRAQERYREKSATVIQAGLRSYFDRKKLFDSIRNEFDSTFSEFTEMHKDVKMPKAVDSFVLLKRFMFVMSDERDKQRFQMLCRYLVLSVDHSEVKLNFASMALSKDHILLWVELMKRILWKCCSKLSELKTDLPTDSKTANLFLHTLVSYTACNGWAFLRSKTEMMTRFIINVLAVPALIKHLASLSQECIALFMTHKIFLRCLYILSTEDHTRRIFDSLDPSYLLCLLGNIIHLGSLEKGILVENLLDFTNVVTRILERCSLSMRSRNPNQMTYLHPIFGWFSQSLDQGLSDAMPLVTSQLQLLWSSSVVKCLFADLVNLLPTEAEANNRGQGGVTMSPGGDRRLSTADKEVIAPIKNLLKKVLDQRNQGSNKQVVQKLGTPEATLVALICSLYQSALSTLIQLKLDILSDDVELYEQNKPFTLSQLTGMAQFANYFVYKVIWDGLMDAKTASSNPLFQAVHGLLMLLYNRDCRRNFAPQNFWLVKEIKPSTFVNELDKRSKRAIFLLEKGPHMIPHKERVMLFRKYVSAEKDELGLNVEETYKPSTLITVHRSRIVEDGYRQLSLLPVKSLKSVIRVKFVNEQGLDEAGIDQDGVFKEFLEETIKRVFNPSLNLFRETSEGRLCPSSTSNVHENHLDLFDFVGRILAKAIYEGIVVEVPFATFFLNYILGKAGGATYSSIDELPSLDPELYKNLTFVKHYEGDVADLDLNFTCEEECMGQIITHELMPGGRTMTLSNENRISYVHLMAHFRMYVQIKNQLQAFVRGFRAIIRPEWLNLFSATELQKLISGDTEDIDLDDLKKHVQYYGGFHSNHRLISWLWDILRNDFSAEERKMFLRDQGDTLGSVIRGFLAVRRKDPVGRLPTSSTCFNLLKLPNYQKKATLREKLRYAISHGAGFELS